MPQVAVVSPMPGLDQGAPPSGVASYTSSLLAHVGPEWEVTVIAQRDASRTHPGGYKVVPTWYAGRTLAALVEGAVRGLAPALVHVHHEFNLFGSVVDGLRLTRAISRLHDAGTPVVTTVHGVVDPGDVDSAFRRRNGLPIPAPAAKQAMAVAYRATARSSDRLIVHHEHFAGILERDYGVAREQIVVIPHGAGATPTPAPSPGAAGPRVLTIGFLTGYKQPELVVEMAEAGGFPSVIFDFRVGANPRITSRRYRARLAELERRVRRLGTRAHWGGFVPDERLDATIEGASVVILPYTECLAVSGIAARAWRAGVPICHSRALRPLFGEDSLEFSLDPRSLALAVGQALGRLGADERKNNALFAPWPDVARATESVWRELLAAP